MRKLILCADDFAQSSAISEGILRLLEQGRLSATSVMSESREWPILAAPLRRFSQDADIGLHLNLTHDFRQGEEQVRPLSYWLLASQLRLLSIDKLRGIFLNQIDRFCHHFGRLPDFLDGHQHIHALPCARTALFQAMEQRWSGDERPYLRAPDLLANPGDDRFKSHLLCLLTHGFSYQANQLGYATPSWFAGMYSLSPEADFADLMEKWLADAPSGALMMCHPGLEANDRDDPIGASRALEYAYLASERFGEACRRLGITLGRFNPALPLSAA
ncbi:ChbG/HpnK family deacetylase [Pseudoduganella violacea]|uniref:Putative glycoside hydrolase/deacetylase ChbG (UPF0249 family) n=1 Tax=Pseudoduganella violacea TaxID=1715466 RepID=A0A7W5BC00_9BURK|nr:ChbG/HpnK family deacetylase [Pseudoduganella violacea]MBB3120040.1 putative glycoside hydrolase/deacetylase ChbG (UPF0249 family) [Pseudoduganella violacea]